MVAEFERVYDPGLAHGRSSDGSQTGLCLLCSKGCFGPCTQQVLSQWVTSITGRGPEQWKAEGEGHQAQVCALKFAELLQRHVMLRDVYPVADVTFRKHESWDSTTHYVTASKQLRPQEASGYLTLCPVWRSGNKQSRERQCGVDRGCFLRTWILTTAMIATYRPAALFQALSPIVTVTRHGARK